MPLSLPLTLLLTAADDARPELSTQRSWVIEMRDRLAACEGEPDEATLRFLLDPAKLDRVLAMSEHEKAQLVATQDLGLAFLPKSKLKGPLTEYEVEKYVAMGNEGWAILRRGDQRLKFPLVRANGRWYLGTGPVLWNPPD